MHTVAFDLRDDDPAHLELRRVWIIIDGRPLEQLAAEVELPHAEAEGTPHLAGDYCGMSLWSIDSSADHYRSEPVATWSGRTALMGCPCGESGCWPLTARVEVSDEAVTWSDFRNGHRPWDLNGLGPFVFDRGGYDAALTAAGLEPSVGPVRW